MFFADRHAQRVIELDPGEIQGRLFDIGAGEGLDAEEQGVFGVEEAAFIHADGGGGDFQQGVGGAVEAAGFHIHDDRQVAAKAFRHRMARAAAGIRVIQLGVEMFAAHALSSSRRQRSFSPARSGITVCSPSGNSPGTIQS
ncbi:hypothetical protein D3C85_779710 [compost metagenome]